MSLILVRVDDRLVHGQTMVWLSRLGATRFLVASDVKADDPLYTRIQRAGIPAGVGLVVDTVAGMVRRLNAGESAGERDILLFDSLEDTLRALDQGLDVRHLNLGGIRHSESCRTLVPGVALNPEEVSLLERIIERGVPVDVQMVPDDKALEVNRSVLTGAGG